jgi:hypothetical protein
LCLVVSTWSLGRLNLNIRGLNLEPWQLKLEPRRLNLEPWQLKLEPRRLSLEL